MFYRAIILNGATAVGKTELSIKLAKQLNAEIISADSTQIYKELNIATAKITNDEMEGINHHLLDIIDIEEDYSVGSFYDDCIKLLDKNIEYIIVGGTGLYTDILNNGMSNLPDKNIEIREKLEKKDITELQKILYKLDIEEYNNIDINNKVRLVRAIEICYITNNKVSLLKKNKQKQKYNFLNIFLTRDRDELYNRINQRVDIMLKNGMLEEGKYIFEKYKDKMCNIKAIGYKQMYEYFIGNISYEKMIEEIKKHSRRYAKRQITWFKNKGYIEINLSHTTIDEAVMQILQIYKGTKNGN